MYCVTIFLSSDFLMRVLCDKMTKCLFLTFKSLSLGWFSLISVSSLVYSSFLQLPIGHLFDYLTSYPGPGPGLIHYLFFPNVSLFCAFSLCSLASVSNLIKIQFWLFSYFFPVQPVSCTVLPIFHLWHISNLLFPFNLFCYYPFQAFVISSLGFCHSLQTGLPFPSSSLHLLLSEQSSWSLLRYCSCSLLTWEIRPNSWLIISSLCFHD